ncbi:MAG: anaerobic ribonucleoside-triphosphate reductase activating protein [Elusimicrobiota bacterium]
MAASNAAATLPLVTAVVPCRNESPFVRKVVASLLASSYPRDRLEVIFVDGLSTDGTRAILEDAAREHAFMRFLDNPLLIAPAAMNIGIRAARGGIIVRMDAHAEYDRDYIPRCVELLLESGPNVGNAGGRSVAVPNGDTPWARAVAFVTTHRFGVGNSAYKVSLRPGLVDTVACGTFSRTALDSVGLYDERLTRNQDNELNARLHKAGYAIAYDPAIRMYYRNQATLKGLLRQAFFTGIWNVYTLSLHPYTWKWRRFVPMGFVVYLAALAASAAWWPRAAAAAAVPLGLYAVLVAIFSTGSGVAAGDRLRVAATFVSYHLSYGAGTLAGIANVLTGRWRDDLSRPLLKLSPARAPSAAPKLPGGLRLGGLAPLSATEYPGSLAAVVFCQGCAWSCVYCGNRHLLAADAAPRRDWISTLEFLRRSEGRLDMVIFSGGEPTLQAGLGDAMREVRGLGLKIGLHTAGPYPERLAEVLSLLDWVVFDVKAPFDRYERINGAPGSGMMVRESLRLLIEHGVDHECRTTVHPALFTAPQLAELSQSLFALGARRHVLQPFRPGACRDATLNSAADAAAIARLIDEAVALSPRAERRLGAGV